MCSRTEATQNAPGVVGGGDTDVGGNGGDKGGGGGDGVRASACE